jgi:CDP-diacylglycerol--serine O-phosphatidyltransferase
MADLVSFGVAPAMILFSVSYYNQSPENIFDTLILGLPSLIYVLAAALRLAWFNSDSAQSKDFKGLASPAAAIALVGLLTYSKETFLDIDNGILYVSVLISAMMLIPVRVLSLKVNTSKIHIFFAIIMALTAATMIIVYGLGALWLVVLIYYAGGIIVYYLSRKILKK